MSFHARSIFCTLLFSASAFAQLPSSQCDSAQLAVSSCTFLTQRSADSQSKTDGEGLLTLPLTGSSGDNDASAFISSQSRTKPERFHWGRALLESFTFLAIEQAYVVHEDYRWVVVENGVPFNHYWRDYKQSLSSWIHSGWNDGDPLMYGYLGHPIQGAMTEYIQIQMTREGATWNFQIPKNTGIAGFARSCGMRFTARNGTSARSASLQLKNMVPRRALDGTRTAAGPVHTIRA